MEHRRRPPRSKAPAARDGARTTALATRIAGLRAAGALHPTGSSPLFKSKKREAKASLFLLVEHTGLEFAKNRETVAI